MFGYFYRAGKSWEDVKLWEATKDNFQEDVNVESFLKPTQATQVARLKRL